MRYLLLVIVTLMTTLPGIWTVPPIDRDEPRFVQATKQMVESGDYVDIRFQDVSRYKKPVGIYWMQAAAVAISGQGAQAPIWVYRLVSVLGAVLSVAGVFWTGSRLFGASAGFAAGVTLAAVFGIVFEAHIAKTDSMLLAVTILAQGALAQLYVSRRNGAVPPGHLAWVFWIALGLGVLLKGPITPLLVVLTMAALWVLDRDRSWQRDLKPLRGIAIVLLIVAPWLIAITWKSGAAFWQESLGSDMMGKVVSGQEAHGMPPGYYLLLFGLYAWPLGPLIMAAALTGLKTLRSDPRIAFLAAWLIPFWLVFEAVPTKLPHYVLPVYPALALLAGLAVAGRGDAADIVPRDWRKWVYRAFLALQGLVTLALAGIVVYAPVAIGAGFRFDSLIAAAAALAAGYFGTPWKGRAKAGDLWRAFAAVVVFYMVTFIAIVPSLTQMWLAPRVAAAFEENKPCANSQLSAYDFIEPSLVFLTGTGTYLAEKNTRTGVDDIGAIGAHLLKDPACAVAVVPDTALDRVSKDVGAAGHTLATLARIDGTNYSNGRELSLRMVRIAP